MNSKLLAPTGPRTAASAAEGGAGLYMISLMTRLEVVAGSVPTVNSAMESGLHEEPARVRARTVRTPGVLRVMGAVAHETELALRRMSKRMSLMAEALGLPLEPYWNWWTSMAMVLVPWTRREVGSL